MAFSYLSHLAFPLRFICLAGFLGKDICYQLIRLLLFRQPDFQSCFPSVAEILDSARRYPRKRHFLSRNSATRKNEAYTSKAYHWAYKGVGMEKFMVPGWLVRPYKSIASLPMCKSPGLQSGCIKSPLTCHSDQFSSTGSNPVPEQGFRTVLELQSPETECMLSALFRNGSMRMRSVTKEVRKRRKSKNEILSLPIAYKVLSR